MFVLCSISFIGTGLGWTTQASWSPVPEPNQQGYWWNIKVLVGNHGDITLQVDAVKSSEVHNIKERQAVQTAKTQVLCRNCGLQWIGVSIGALGRLNIGPPVGPRKRKVFGLQNVGYNNL